MRRLRAGWPEVDGNSELVGDEIDEIEGASEKLAGDVKPVRKEEGKKQKCDDEQL